MEEQLPIPLLELIVFHIYLSSITLLSGIIALFLIMRLNNNFSWLKYITHSIILLLIVTMLSLLIWVVWPFNFDFMLGPFHLPTMAILIMFLGIYGFKTKTNKSETILD
jgi:hypothetical protein